MIVQGMENADKFLIKVFVIVRKASLVQIAVRGIVIIIVIKMVNVLMENATAMLALSETLVRIKLALTTVMREDHVLMENVYAIKDSLDLYIIF
jgi:hypothetical protein